MRKYAVAIVEDLRIVSIPVRRRSLREAVHFARTYDRLARDADPPGVRQAVILRHPISAALRLNARRTA